MYEWEYDSPNVTVYYLHRSAYQQQLYVKIVVQFTINKASTFNYLLVLPIRNKEKNNLIPPFNKQPKKKKTTIIMPPIGVNHKSFVLRQQYHIKRGSVFGFPQHNKDLINYLYCTANH